MYGQRIDSGGTVANGLSAQVRVDSNRMLMVTPTVGGAGVSSANPIPFYQVTAAGVPIAYGFTATQITTATTTNLKTGAGMIGSIIVNKTGTTDVITVYDALTATGTPLATITAPTVGMAFCVGYNFGVGLTVVTSGTPGNYTVAYA